MSQRASGVIWAIVGYCLASFAFSCFLRTPTALLTAGFPVDADQVQKYGLVSGAVLGALAWAAPLWSAVRLWRYGQPPWKSVYAALALAVLAVGLFTLACGWRCQLRLGDESIGAGPF